MKVNGHVISLMADRTGWPAERLNKHLKVLNIKNIEDAIAYFNASKSGSKDRERAKRTWDRLVMEKLHKATTKKQVAAALGASREDSEAQDLALARLYKMTLRATRSSVY